jgi:hypothetical protein
MITYGIPKDLNGQEHLAQVPRKQMGKGNARLLLSTIGTWKELSWKSELWLGPMR